MNLRIRREFVLLSYIFTAQQSRYACVRAIVRTFTVCSKFAIFHLIMYNECGIKALTTVMSLKLLILSKRFHIRVRKSVKFE